MRLGTQKFYNRKSHFQEMWAKRDVEVQDMLDRINAFLRTPRGATINTSAYDVICLQWLEYAVLSPRQIETLKFIVERFDL